MTVDEVVKKLAIELVLETGHTEDFSNYRKIIKRAVVIGTEHFTVKMEEVVAMNREGVEIGRYKSADEAAKKLDIPRGNVFQVLERLRPTAHGLKFIYVRDLELVKREKNLPQ
jgi:hypothetical protein